MSVPPNNEPTRLALVVVTDPVTLQVCRETLGNAGFIVSNGVASGAAAVVHAREQHPDLILLSQQLSDVPAPEAVKWLRSNRESVDTPIIILGGKSDGTTNSARVIILPRPITASQLRCAVTEAIGDKNATRRAAP